MRELLLIGACSGQGAQEEAATKLQMLVDNRSVPGYHQLVI